MPTILSLPNEILGRIIQATHPSDLESLAFTTKHIYVLAGKALKRHLLLKQRYSVLKVGHFRTEGAFSTGDALAVPPGHATTAIILLDRIIEEPDIAYYPRTLHLGEPPSPGEKDSRISKKLRSITASHTVTLKNLLDWCHLLSEGWEEDLIPNVFDDELALQLLLTALPNLKSVSQHCEYSYTSRTLGNLIEEIASRNRTEWSPFPGKVLTKLQHFSVLPRNSDSPVNMEDFASFGMLPSMRVLSGSRIGCRDFSWPDGFDGGRCSITDLDITHSAVQSDAMEELIIGIPDLKRFKYHHSGTEVGDAHYRPNTYVAALRTHAFANLESLDIWVQFPELLSEDEKDGQYIGSLRMFSALENIRLETVAFERVEPDESSDDETLDSGKFYQDKSSRRLEAMAAKGSNDGEDTDDNCWLGEQSQDEEDVTALESLMDPLVNVLPPSVKFLTLIQRSNDADMRDLLKGLVMQKAEELPNLSKVTFECLEPVEEDIKSELTGAGIEVEETEGLLDRRERRFMAGRIIYDD